MVKISPCPLTLFLLTHENAAMLRIEVIPALQDNYIWAIVGNGHCAIVDPGDAAPILSWLHRHKLQLCAILVTHHHGDHTGGIAALLARFSVPVYGPAREAIAHVSHPVDEGDCVALPEIPAEFRVISVPGHTRGHVAYFGHGMLFCGDTLFACGCGRIFEGSAEQMHDSLQRLAALPGETQVYCTHEYTLSNIAFALSVDAGNAELTQRAETERARRAQGLPTLPSTIALEQATNPFLRCHEAAVRQAAESYAQRPLTTPSEVFAVAREMKNQYRQ